MRGPPRLLESGAATEIERSLLRAGLDDRPSDEWMRDTRALLGLATGVAAASTIASTAAAAKWGTPVALKWLAALLATSTIVGSAALVAHRRALPAPVAFPAIEEQLTFTPSEAPPSAPAAEQATLQESPPAAPSRPERAAGTPKTLGAEVAQLDSVKQFLVAGNAAAALNALAKYHFHFPTPMLGPEATVLEVQALMAQGDATHRARAIALARRFVKMHPTSPHASQLEMLISKAREP
jgi:hypothetical protein